MGRGLAPCSAVPAPFPKLAGRRSGSPWESPIPVLQQRNPRWERPKLQLGPGASGPFPREAVPCHAVPFPLPSQAGRVLIWFPVGIPYHCPAAAQLWMGNTRTTARARALGLFPRVAMPCRAVPCHSRSHSQVGWAPVRLPMGIPIPILQQRSPGWETPKSQPRLGASGPFPRVAKPCCTMLCRAVPCHAVPCRAALYRTVPCHAVLCRAMPYCAVPCHRCSMGSRRWGREGGVPRPHAGPAPGSETRRLAPRRSRRRAGSSHSRLPPYKTVARRSPRTPRRPPSRTPGGSVGERRRRHRGATEPGRSSMGQCHCRKKRKDCQELTDVERAIETVINQFHCYAVKGQKEFLTPNELRELVLQKLPHLGKCVGPLDEKIECMGDPDEAKLEFGEYWDMMGDAAKGCRGK
ncbi:uncharacterized protein LOC134152469 [Rhea pennata]|uniref:uncharacterized protein LOC134152469 n=1 Tax=Rhea pennata TaxID=8795 RepID=UPI002E2684F6